MEPVTIKFEEDFIKFIESIMKRHHYATISEFIRDAFREKVKELEKDEMLKSIEKIAGSSKRKTTDEDLHTARELLAKKFQPKSIQ